jgi:hypothetical protein
MPSQPVNSYWHSEPSQYLHLQGRAVQSGLPGLPDSDFKTMVIIYQLKWHTITKDLNVPHSYKFLQQKSMYAVTLHPKYFFWLFRYSSNSCFKLCKSSSTESYSGSTPLLGLIRPASLAFSWSNAVWKRNVQVHFHRTQFPLNSEMAIWK